MNNKILQQIKYRALLLIVPLIGYIGFGTLHWTTNYDWAIILCLLSAIILVINTVVISISDYRRIDEK